MKLNSEYSNHPVWDSLAELGKVLEDKKLGNGPLDLAIKQKLKAAVEYLLSFRKKFVLAPANWPAHLENVSRELNLILNQLSNWVEGGISATALNAIETSIDTSIQIVGYWPVQVNSKTDKYVNDARLLLEEISNYRVEQASKFEDLKKETILLQNNLEKAIALWNEESDLLSTIRRELKSTSSDFALETKKELADEAAIIKKELNTNFEEVLVDATEMRDKIQSLVRESENLAALQAGEVLSAGYEAHARRKEKTKLYWNFMGFIVVTLGVGVLVFTYLSVSTLEVGLQYLFKISITLTISALAAYSFKEAGSAGKAAEIARYRHLDSVALSTYTKGLAKDETRDEIQLQLGQRLASERDFHEKSDAKAVSKFASQIVKSLENIINRQPR